MSTHILSSAERVLKRNRLLMGARDDDEHGGAAPSPTPSPEQRTPTFVYSSMCAEGFDPLRVIPVSSGGLRNFDGALASPARSSTHEVFVRGSLLDRNITARAQPANAKPERKKDYGGRRRVWPGFVLFLLLAGGAAAAMTYYGLMERHSRDDMAVNYEQNNFNSTRIQGGKGANSSDDLVSDDGAIGNPKKYPPSACEQPNYLSKNGRIVAVSANGTEVPLQIKGINWFGMETGQAVPLGLWDNNDNGTTAYQVATFLRNNNFNAVRLPVMVAALLDNRVPNTYIVNKQENRALDLTSYMSTLKSIIKVLQYRRIGVLISMHTLTQYGNGDLWYNKDISEDMFLSSIDVLTKNLCSMEYWNIMGIDVKNEPYKGTWGDGTATDFRAGAIRIANRMLKGCPKWLGFVEGVNAQHEITIDGQDFGYYDWFGGGLHGARTKGIEFSIPKKVVWAPHYYTPAVFPQYYLYGGGKVGPGNVINGYVELSDAKLRNRIKVTMDDMFGFLASDTGPALLLGEFGGLYAEDKHPKKTTKRCTDFTIEIIKKWAGGFVWSLNPESAYQFNPADNAGNFVEGMVQKDWLHANTEFLDGMAAMDDMPDLQLWPCFKTVGKADSSSSS